MFGVFTGLILNMLSKSALMCNVHKIWLDTLPTHAMSKPGFLVIVILFSGFVFVSNETSRWFVD